MIEQDEIQQYMELQPANRRFTKALHKNEVASLLDISTDTLAKWLNKRYFTELQKIGYQTSQRILTPKILNFLQEKIDLQP